MQKISTNRFDLNRIVFVKPTFCLYYFIEINRVLQGMLQTRYFFCQNWNSYLKRKLTRGSNTKSKYFVKTLDHNICQNVLTKNLSSIKFESAKILPETENDSHIQLITTYDTIFWRKIIKYLKDSLWEKAYQKH